jgi:hypothetical protein
MQEKITKVEFITTLNNANDTILKFIDDILHNYYYDCDKHFLEKCFDAAHSLQSIIYYLKIAERESKEKYKGYYERSSSIEG